MEDVSYVTAGQFYSIVVLKDESMWLLPNQDLIASNPDQKYVPEKLMDHATKPQIEIERISRKGIAWQISQQCFHPKRKPLRKILKQMK